MNRIVIRLLTQLSWWNLYKHAKEVTRSGMLQTWYRRPCHPEINKVKRIHLNSQPGVVVLTVLILLNGHTASASDRKPITWNNVYGLDRIVIRDPAPRDFVWLDTMTLLRLETVWEKVNAVTGKAAPLYDAKRLRQQLLAGGIPDEDADEIADGNWTLHDAARRICVLQTDRRLTLAGLDGEHIRIVNGLPKQIELLTLSPVGNACAFVSGNDLWSANFETGNVLRLTQDSGPDIRNGKADWVYFEEILKRTWKAFRFSPDGQSLLFQQFDDTSVPNFSIIDHTNPVQNIETEHFPVAGQCNPMVRLGIVSVNGGSVSWVKSPLHDSSTLITHFGWYPDSSHVYWYVQNRRQTWLDLVRTSTSTGSSNTLLREQTSGWVEQPGDLHFLSDHSFLMLSERSGWRHIERISADAATRQPLTSGPWDVTGIHAVNESKNQVIVTGTRRSPIADDLYRVDLDGGSLLRLSQEPGHHTVSVNPSGSLLIDSWSSHSQRRSVVLRNSAGHVVRQIHRATPPDEWTEFEFGNVGIEDVPLADQTSAAAIVVSPPDFNKSRAHPVWIRIYGGPRSPQVSDTWHARLDDHLLAGHGIVVIRFDPRTAGGHGAAGAWKAYGQLGVEETRDVESVCEWLATQSWADQNRIGMSGHSYGGFLTSYVMTHSNCLTAGIAGSPVTNWANYDTIYTERYMGTPQENPHGYRRSSVVAAAGNLHGRLLLAHGLQDDNVHPANTFQLVQALQNANRTFDLMVYPRARHGIHDQHFETLKYNFILESLGIFPLPP